LGVPPREAQQSQQEQMEMAGDKDKLWQMWNVVHVKITQTMSGDTVAELIGCVLAEGGILVGGEFAADGLLMAEIK